MVGNNKRELRFKLKTDTSTPSTVIRETITLDADINKQRRLELNKWIHVTATYDGILMRIYRDGYEVGRIDKKGEIPFEKVSVWIGANPKDAYGAFDGVIDEVSVFNRTLSYSEINYLVKQYIFLKLRAEILKIIGGWLEIIKES